MDDYNDEYYSCQNLMDIIVPKKALKQIMIYEKTVELVAIVESVEIKANLLKFILINNEGDKIQVLAWDDAITKIKNLIVPYNIIHIDAAFARSRNETMSSGTISYDLTIMSNTNVTILGKVKSSDEIAKMENIPTVSIEDCLNHTGEIEIVGYIKNSITEISLPSAKICQGCITDCKHYKLEIRMPVSCDMSEFVIGAHVRICGNIKYGQCAYLYVTDRSKIKLESEPDWKNLTVL